MGDHVGHHIDEEVFQNKLVATPEGVHEIHRTVRIALRDRLKRCPPDHRDALESEIMAAFERAAWEQEEDGEPIQFPKAYALTIARRMIVRHLSAKAHSDLRLDTLLDVPDTRRGWTDPFEEIERAVALEQELEKLSKTEPEAVEAFRHRLRGEKLITIALICNVAISTVDRWIRLVEHILSLALAQQK